MSLSHASTIARGKTEATTLSHNAVISLICPLKDGFLLEHFEFNCGDGILVVLLHHLDGNVASCARSKRRS